MELFTAESPARTIPFEAAADILGNLTQPNDYFAASECPGVYPGLYHVVPKPLRHIGCMWLDEGDESRRCREHPAWTMGSGFQRPRVYCESHGRRILARRLEERKRRRLQRDRQRQQELVLSAAAGPLESEQTVSWAATTTG